MGENKILILIDNIFIYDQIKEIIRIKNRNDVEFDFFHSPIKTEIWSHPDFLNKNKQLDIKISYHTLINKYHTIISIHCLQLFPKELVEKVRCINVHPGYNPINRGWYPQIFSIIRNIPIGATIHEMDEELDHGMIIARKFVDKYIWDTSLSLYQRVINAELELFDVNFDKIIDNTYNKIQPETEGNLFLKKNFTDLCLIDLNEKGTFEDFYNRLRALSHGQYKNAYFIDSKTGKKVYIKLDTYIDENE